MQNIQEYKSKLEKCLPKLDSFSKEKLDQDHVHLKGAFDICYEDGLFEIGGAGKEQAELFKLELFKSLTKISGTLSFLAIQILAANAIMQKNDYAKKEEYFKKKCGIAINHLRAPVTVVNAKRCEGGYLLSGTLTWASGYEIFDTLLIGFHFEGRELEAMAPFESSQGFEIGTAESTFVGFGLNTVNIELKDFFVKDEDIVSSNPIGTYTLAKSLSKTVHFCIYAVGNSAIENIKDGEFKQSVANRLDEIKEAFMQTSDPGQMDILRVELFKCVQDIVTTAMVLNGGGSILSRDNFQRHYRELIMFNSNGLNQGLKSIFKDKFIRG